MQRAQTPKSNLREAIRNVAGPITFSNRVLLLYAYPSFATFFMFDLLPIIGDLDQRPIFIEWLMVSIVGYLAVVAVMLLFRATVLPATFREPKIALTGLALLVAGLARAVSVNALGVALGVIPREDVPFRLASGPILTFGILATIAIYVASVTRNEDAVIKLRREKAILDELRGSIRERIRFQREEIIRQIRKALEPVISQLEDTADSATSVAVLTSAVDEVVRPLSHTIGKIGSPTAATDSLDRVIENVVRERQKLPKRVSLGSMLVALIITFTVTTAGSGALIGLVNGPTAPLAVICLAIGIWVSFKLLQLMAQNLWLPVWGVIVAIVPLSVIPTAVVSLLLASIGSVFSPTIYVQFYVLVLVSTSISMMMQISRTLRNESELQLREVVADLELVNSELRQQVWNNQRRIASILHGSVQAAIYAGAMKLSQSPTLDRELLTSVRRDVDAAIFKLNTDAESADVASVVEQISSVWKGIAEIRLEKFDVLAKQALDTNSVAANCLIEVVREAVTNAIKHGKAKNVTVEISSASERLVALRVQNDGLPAELNASAGFGSELLNELTHEWSLGRNGDSTFLSAKIPVSKISR